MRILKEASAGAFEANDCLVTVRPLAYELQIELESSVMARYGQKIKDTALYILQRMGINNGFISIKDKGALDYCIKARIITAVKRAGETNDR